MLSKSLFSQTGSIWLIQLVVVIIPIIDTYFLSYVSSENVAAYALANSFYILWIVASKGLLQGLCFAVAPCYGSQQYQKTGLLLTQSLWVVFFVTLCSWGLLYFSSVGIKFYIMSNELKQLSVQYLYSIALSLPAIFCLRILSAWLQGVSSPHTLILWYWLGLFFKFVITYLLIMGYLGSQWQNTSGIALSTTLFYWFVLIGLFVQTKLQFSIKYQFKLFAPIDIKAIVMILRYGLPLAVAYLVEFSIFPFINSLLIIYQQEMLVAHEILSRVYALILSLPIAFMLATSIQIGQNYQVEILGTKFFALTTEKIMIVIVFCLGLIAYITQYTWISYYHQNLNIVAMVVAVLPIAILRFSIESLQSLWAFNLRAINKGWSVVFISMICLWGAVLLMWFLHSYISLSLKEVWLCLALGYAVALFLLRKKFIIWF